MAAFDYAPLVAKAKTLLDRYGAKGCRLMREGVGAPDPEKPWAPWTPEPDAVVASGLTVVGDNIGYRRGKRDASQALTQTASGKAYMVGTVEQALPGDRLEVPNGQGGYDRFFISRAEPIKPGSVIVMWELSLRA